MNVNYRFGKTSFIHFNHFLFLLNIVDPSVGKHVIEHVKERLFH